MNEKNIVVPSGMARVAWDAMDHHVKVHGPAVGCFPGSMCSLTVGLEAALRWMIDDWNESPNARRAPDPWYSNSLKEWESFVVQWKNLQDVGFADLLFFFGIRMNERFLAAEPEPEMPEEIVDLMVSEKSIQGAGAQSIESAIKQLNQRTLEAFRRGQVSAK